MAPKPLPKGNNTTGINPDGTPAIGTPEQMKPLMEQAKRWQEAYDRGEIPDEPFATPLPAAGEDESDFDEDVSDLNDYDHLLP
jgi:hypothetical protein